MKTDLSYLRSMSGDSVELIQEMIDIFTEQVEEFKVELQAYLDRKDYEALGKLAHKAKSSVAIMGMDDLAKDLKELELLAKNGEKQEKYKVYIDRFKTDCTEAVHELESFKKSIAEH
ncbi:MAG TPA: Hpt domain-containing protein [Bacteroidales bacterium]|nr:Hpt domain-containing protein [Bacteroidales bacterium]